MAIKFEFTVDDFDAETIFQCVENRIADMIGAKLDEMSGLNRKDLIHYYDDYIQYLKELQTKILNTHVEDS